MRLLPSGPVRGSNEAIPIVLASGSIETSCRAWGLSFASAPTPIISRASEITVSWRVPGGMYDSPGRVSSA